VQQSAISDGFYSGSLGATSSLSVAEKARTGNETRLGTGVDLEDHKIFEAAHKIAS
jgi:hypothetical protein